MRHLLVIGAILGSFSGCSQPPTTATVPAPAAQRPCVAPATATAQNVKDPAPVAAELALAGTTPTYDSAIKPMMDNYCNSCHASRKRPHLTTYQEVVAAARDSLGTMQDGSMPTRDPMPADQIALFQAWVDAGTPESGATAAPVTTAPATTAPAAAETAGPATTAPAMPQGKPATTKPASAIGSGQKPPVTTQPSKAGTSKTGGCP